ncbi:hypothetical protein D9M71_393730 [compost metagenome]
MLESSGTVFITSRRIRTGRTARVSIRSAQASIWEAEIARKSGTYVLTAISFSDARATYWSYWAWSARSSSELAPNAFSMRSAISAERAAFPFKRLDRAGLPTSRISAALLTVIAEGRTSRRIYAPGCSGAGLAMTNLRIALRYTIRRQRRH